MDGPLIRLSFNTNMTQANGNNSGITITATSSWE